MQSDTAVFIGGDRTTRDPERGTGRTSRMLESAIGKLLFGRRVLVVMDTEMAARQACRMVAHLLLSHMSNLTCSHSRVQVGDAFIRFVSRSNPLTGERVTVDDILWDHWVSEKHKSTAELRYAVDPA